MVFGLVNVRLSLGQTQPDATQAVPAQSATPASVATPPEEID
jgi:hypothetical protein